MGPPSTMLSTRQLHVLFNRFFDCRSCTIRRLPTSPRVGRLTLCTERRHASSLISNTAINAIKPVPDGLRPLYEALADVRKHAMSHVNTSRLQLVLQGLESSNPTIRLAVLGIDVPDTARRLVRLLLADPLEAHAKWESQVASGQHDYSRGLIIRYGQASNPNIPRPQNSIPVLYVHASILERCNIEILVSSVNGPSLDPSSQNAGTPPDTFLSPVVGTPTSFNGRQTVISQPVHKCLLVTHGLDEFLAASQLLATTNFTSRADRNLVHVAVDMNGAGNATSAGKTYVFDVQKADEGLAAIRESVKRATEYEHKWIDAGMPALTQWVTASAAATAPAWAAGEDTMLPTPVKHLLVSVLEAASVSVQRARSAAHRDAAERGLRPAERSTLDIAVDKFSRFAHQELQSGLASAWSSVNWQKLAWYKLFWRVDDVGLILTDLVTNAWLPKTERAVYELSGRFVQAGVNPIMESEHLTPVGAQTQVEVSVQPAFESATQLGTVAIAASPSPLISSSPSTQAVIINTAGHVAIEPDPASSSVPISAFISHARAVHMSNAISSLTSTAQQLVLRTLSITGLTGGLSVLTYFSSLSGTLYEAGTIAAVGVVFALWRMQGGWQKATAHLEHGLFTEGRNTIVDITDRMKMLVDANATPVEDVVGKELLDKAERSISRANIELGKVAKPQASEIRK